MNTDDQNLQDLQAKHEREAATILLQQSIQVWRRKREAVLPGEIGMGYEACPLCARYAERKDCRSTHCFRCPIYKVNRVHNCGDTPYVAVYDAYNLWDNSPEDEDLREAFRTAVDAELAFMEEVLAAWTSPADTPG